MIICNYDGLSDNTIDYGVTASSVVHFMPLARKFHGVAVLSADSLSGSVFISWPWPDGGF